MSVSLIPDGRTPSQTQWGLDQFVEHYRASDAADVVLTDSSVPQRGDPHPDYPFMLITERRVAETGEKASALDLVYTGIMKFLTSGTLLVGTIYVIGDYHSGDDFTNVGASSNAVGTNFVATGTTPSVWSNGSKVYAFPPAKLQQSRAIQSSTTYTSSLIFPDVAAVPASVQYYAPTNVMILLATTPTPPAEPDDPLDITVDDLITWTLQAEQPASSLPAIAAWLLANAFVQRITEVLDSQEIVASGFWLVTKRKTKLLLPWAPPS